MAKNPDAQIANQSTAAKSKSRRLLPAVRPGTKRAYPVVTHTHYM